MAKKQIEVMGHKIEIDKNDYISLTDIARKKNITDPKYVVRNWLRNRMTLEFLGLWESINNPNFKVTEFDNFRIQAGLNSFTLSFSEWIEKTKAIGLISTSGRYGGTYAHKDIALEFASWVSVEFKLYLIKEFQRLKEAESSRQKLEWNVKRTLTKVNYRIHTDAVKENLIPSKISPTQAREIYANEADVLNMALFGMTAKDWRDSNKGKSGNIRDYANISQLVCLSNLENLNSVFINEGLEQSERLVKLNQIAISQMSILTQDTNIKKLGGNKE